MTIVKHIVKALERVAPLRLAEKWDKVGLIIGKPIDVASDAVIIFDPSLSEAPHPRQNADSILVTIDLTTAVVDEALSTNAGFIVTYHPPIFTPLPSLTLSNPLQASLLRCAAAGISVYCPHTSWDSVDGGINDWLASCLTDGAEPASKTYIGEPAPEGDGGPGRLILLDKPISMKALEQRIKKNLSLNHIQVAYSTSRTLEQVQSIAICAGSGGGVVIGIDADVYFTGEIAHHDVLAGIASGHNVVLCGHTNTERGYLPTVAKKLAAALNAVTSEAPKDFQSQLSSLKVQVSEADHHPLHVV